MHELLSKRRKRSGLKAPHLMNLRKVLKGSRYKRGKEETRGRKLKFTKANVLTMNKARSRDTIRDRTAQCQNPNAVASNIRTLQRLDSRSHKGKDEHE